jgi:hypothetical protein
MEISNNDKTRYEYSSGFYILKRFKNNNQSTLLSFPANIIRYTKPTIKHNICTINKVLINHFFVKKHLQHSMLLLRVRNIIFNPAITAIPKPIQAYARLLVVHGHIALKYSSFSINPNTVITIIKLLSHVRVLAVLLASE